MQRDASGTYATTTAGEHADAKDERKRYGRERRHRLAAGLSEFRCRVTRGIRALATGYAHFSTHPLFGVRAGCAFAERARTVAVCPMPSPLSSSMTPRG